MVPSLSFSFLSIFLPSNYAAREFISYEHLPFLPTYAFLSSAFLVVNPIPTRSGDVLSLAAALSLSQYP